MTLIRWEPKNGKVATCESVPIHFKTCCDASLEQFLKQDHSMCFIENKQFILEKKKHSLIWNMTFIRIVQFQNFASQLLAQASWEINV